MKENPIATSRLPMTLTTAGIVVPRGRKASAGTTSSAMKLIDAPSMMNFCRGLDVQTFRGHLAVPFANVMPDVGAVPWFTKGASTFASLSAPLMLNAGI
jgi:hypothetical protein